jgi:hypothetical protein
VINGFKGSLLAGFDAIPELIVNCCVHYHSLGSYIIPFIFLIGYSPDIVKITKIQTIFKNMQSVMECVICCAQNI